jgi:hypothetical protein
MIRGKRCRHRLHQEEISVRLSISTRPVRRHDGAIDRKHLNIDQRQGKTPMMHLTGLYCVPMALMMMGLSAHVSILRGKTAISILDGGNITLAERIRPHRRRFADMALDADFDGEHRSRPMGCMIFEGPCRIGLCPFVPMP